MNVYDLLMNPLEKLCLKNLRKRYIYLADGKVLEIGIGTGANLPFYNYTKIKELIGLDVKLSNKIKRKVGNDITLVKGSAENIPFEDNTFDTVVISLVLCSVENPKKSIDEIKRVLKPCGKLIFIEHILPSEGRIANIFNSINAVWTRLTRGCNLNRQTDKLIAENFKAESMNKATKDILYFGVAINNKKAKKHNNSL